ncbi:MAG: (Fe-S)-binding protein [Candidatus Solibacter usitatus]|nr:(Fe-S)-binding protein [Candidatus Solibacter usitatus]
MQPSWPEMLIFAALLCISLYGFWRRFRVVVHAIRQAKPDASWTLGSVAARTRAFIWEVLLQGKVIRDRPLAGIAHAFVFWGFCAFALVTLNHFAQGFGFNLIPRQTAFGQIYYGFVGLFAVAVAISIASLAVRRYLVRPIWLGKVAPESGYIALLIFVLMVTYLATFRVEEASVAGRVNWWLHTLALLIFMPLIPHTKHLHLVLSPATIFLRRQGFSQIPPLAGDEDFGLDTGKDLTRLIALQAYSCVECGRCTELCPAYNTGKILNPKEIILGVRDYLTEFGAAGAEPLLGKHISEEAAFQCTTCGGCEYACPVGIQHLPVIIGLRRGAVNTGKWENEYGAKFFLTLERYGNSLGFAASERQKFLEKNSLPIYDGTQEYCLWLGCMGGYDPQGRDIVLSFARVLNHLGITYGVLRKEKCTGDPVRRLGNDYLFSQLAEPNIQHLNESKVSKLVSICPHCVRTIGEDWKELGASFQIEHHSELMARHRERLPSADGAREKVVYHDPCYLGRYRNVYDQPREVLARAAEVVDPPKSREHSFCCGAGGGMMFLGEEKGKRVNVARAEELAGTGATTVGAACPFCQSMFRDALAQVSPNPPKLLDIAQIAAASLDAQRPNA